MSYVKEVYSDKVKGKITESCPDCRDAVYMTSTGFVYKTDLDFWVIEFKCENGETLCRFSEDYMPLIKEVLSEQNIDE